MGINEIIASLLQERERDYAWLHRQTRINYKRLLRIAKHGTQAPSLLEAAVIADVLGVEIQVLIPAKAAA